MAQAPIAIPTMFLAAWGNLAATIARALPFAPELSPRLMYAVPADFHCYGAYLRLTDPRALADEALAKELMRPPADLLREVFPDCAEPLAIAFSRIDEPTVLTPRSYRRLAEAMRGAGRGALMSGRPITLASLCHAEVLANLDPLVGAAERILDQSPGHSPQLHAFIVLLRSAGCLGDEDQARKELRDLDLNGFKAFIQSRLSGAQAAPSPFSFGTGLRALTSVAGLREAVGRLKPTDFMSMTTEFALVLGGVIVIELEGEEPGLALLRREPFGIFSLARYFGQFGAKISLSGQSDLLTKLQSAGVNISPVGSLEAFSDFFGEAVLEEFCDSQSEIGWSSSASLDPDAPDLDDLPWSDDDDVQATGEGSLVASATYSAWHPKRTQDGKAVGIVAPSRPSSPATWHDPRAIARFVPAGLLPEALSGIRLKPAPQHLDSAWIEELVGREELDPPWPVPERDAPLSRKSGAIVQEPDGRVWVVVPSNHFANTTATFPKGEIESGDGARPTAWREVLEETGLIVRLERHLTDVVRGDAIVRLYLATRVGGAPTDMGWESQCVMLIPPEMLDMMLTADKETSLLAAAALLPGPSTSECR